MALELKCIILTNLIRVSYSIIAVTYTLTFLLNSCTQAARLSASVIKGGWCAWAYAYQGVQKESWFRLQINGFL